MSVDEGHPAAAVAVGGLQCDPAVWMKHCIEVRTAKRQATGKEEAEDTIFSASSSTSCFHVRVALCTSYLSVLPFSSRSFFGMTGGGGGGGGV